MYLLFKILGHFQPLQRTYCNFIGILRVTGCQNMCNVQAMTTSENLAFMGQTITALKQVIVEMQTGTGNAYTYLCLPFIIFLREFRRKPKEILRASIPIARLLCNNCIPLVCLFKIKTELYRLSMDQLPY